jgi:hypothetical protein
MGLRDDVFFYGHSVLKSGDGDVTFPYTKHEAYEWLKNGIELKSGHKVLPPAKKGNAITWAKFVLDEFSKGRIKTKRSSDNSEKS